MVQANSIPGWYGKLPVLGDFASRRLPQDVIVAWDAWLQQGMSYSQEHLAADWLDSYLKAPVWRFVLGEHTLDTQIWAGIVLPSVDRVGRYFPLTLCASLSGFNFSAETLAALDDWMSALEDVGRAGLDPQFSVDDFDARLAACHPPFIQSSPASALGESLARGDSFLPLAVSGAGGLPGLLGDVAGSASKSLFAHHSLWWCAEPGGVTGGFACRGLPSAAVFARMLQYSPATA